MNAFMILQDVLVAELAIAGLALEHLVAAWYGVRRGGGRDD